MRGGCIAGLVSLWLLALSGMAWAQEGPADPGAPAGPNNAEAADSAADMAAQLIDGLTHLATQRDVQGASFTHIGPLVEAVFHDLPVEDDYALSIGFEIMNRAADDHDLRGDGDLRPVLVDAQACSERLKGLEVIRFDVLSIDGMDGYRCVATGPDDVEPDGWVWVSAMVLTGVDRHLDVRLAAATVSEEGGLARATEVGLSRLESLSALAMGIEETAIGILRAAALD